MVMRLRLVSSGLCRALTNYWVYPGEWSGVEPNRSAGSLKSSPVLRGTGLKIPTQRAEILAPEGAKTLCFFRSSFCSWLRSFLYCCFCCLSRCCFFSCLCCHDGLLLILFRRFIFVGPECFPILFSSPIVDSLSSHVHISCYGSVCFSSLKSH